MKILLAHPGTQHAPILARELFETGHLYKYFTSLSFGESTTFGRLFPGSLRRRRTIKDLPDDRLKIQPWLEIIPYFVKAGVSTQSAYAIKNYFFQKGISDADIRRADAVIGFDTSSWILGERAKQHGKNFFLEVTTPHPAVKAEIDEAVAEMYPAWVKPGRSGVQEKREITENVEMRSAAGIVVASQFVKDSYVSQGCPEEKITVNPYGVSMHDFALKRYDPVKKVKFLFFGSLTAFKGVPVLLEAWRKLKPTGASLTLAGYGTLPQGVIIPDGVTVLGRVERDQRQALFQQNDVLVFPSFYEGFGLVLLEAALAGLPVVGTVNSFAAEFVRNGVEGYVIPTGSADELASRLAEFVDHPDKIEMMGRAAHAAAAAFTWRGNAQRWVDLIKASAGNSK